MLMLSYFFSANEIGLSPDPDLSGFLAFLRSKEVD
jgi:hypothetical protein